MSAYDNYTDERPATLAEILAETIEFLNIGDDMAELISYQQGNVYAADDSVQKDLRRLQQVFIDNPHFDDMLYLAAFSRGEDDIYTRSRFNNGHS